MKKVGSRRRLRRPGIPGRLRGSAGPCGCPRPPPPAPFCGSRAAARFPVGCRARPPVEGRQPPSRPSCVCGPVFGGLRAPLASVALAAAARPAFRPVLPGPPPPRAPFGGALAASPAGRCGGPWSARPPGLGPPSRPRQRERRGTRDEGERKRRGCHDGSPSPFGLAADVLKGERSLYYANLVAF